jgi:precorrin-6B methylase 1
MQLACARLRWSLSEAEVVTIHGRPAERLVRWLQPRAVCMVGLSGWRSAIDRRATEGWQAEPFGGRPVYVMSNTSGLNARVPLAALARHLRLAAESGPHTTEPEGMGR